MGRMSSPGVGGPSTTSPGMPGPSSGGPGFTRANMGGQGSGLGVGGNSSAYGPGSAQSAVDSDEYFPADLGFAGQRGGMVPGVGWAGPGVREVPSAGMVPSRHSPEGKQPRSIIEQPAAVAEKEIGPAPVPKAPVPVAPKLISAKVAKEARGDEGSVDKKPPAPQLKQELVQSAPVLTVPLPAQQKVVKERKGEGDAPPPPQGPSNPRFGSPPSTPPSTKIPKFLGGKL